MRGGFVKVVLIVIAVLTGLAILVVGGGAWYAHSTIQSATSKPLVLPSPLGEPTEVEVSLESKLEEARKILTGSGTGSAVSSAERTPSGENSPPVSRDAEGLVDLVLDQDEVNALLRKHLDEAFRNAIHVELGSSNDIRVRAPIKGKDLAPMLPPETARIAAYIRDNVNFVNLDMEASFRVEEGRLVFKVTRVLQPVSIGGQSVATIIQDVTKQMADGGTLALPIGDGAARIRSAEVLNGMLHLKLEP